MSAFLRMCVLVLVVQATASELDAELHDFEEQVSQLGKRLTMTNASAMLQEFQEMARSGSAPAFDQIKKIKELITEDVIPPLDATHKAAVDQENANEDAIKVIDTDMQEKSKALKDGKGKSVADTRVDLKACRTAEESQYVAGHGPGSQCREFKAFLGSVQAAPELPTKEDGSLDRESTVAYVTNRIKSKMCKFTGELKPFKDNCDDTATELNTKASACAQIQEKFELEFCEWKDETFGAGESYSTQREAAEKTYDVYKADTTILVTKWQAEWQSLEKILCFCDVWLSETDTDDAARSKINQEGFDKCNELETNTTKYAVTFSASFATGSSLARLPVIKDDPACTEDVCKYPGTGGFLNEYKEMGGKTTNGVDVPALAAAVDACTVPAPAPESPAPAAASCVKVGAGSLSRGGAHRLANVTFGSRDDIRALAIASQTQARYVKGAESSNSCPVGSIPITSAEACRSAAITSGFAAYRGASAYETHPKGCYHSQDFGIWFNNPSTGSGQPQRQLICDTKAITWECTVGRTQEDGPYKFKTDANNKAACAAQCEAAPGCVAFDFSGDSAGPNAGPLSAAPNACRGVGSGQTPRMGGDVNRKYCTPKADEHDQRGVAAMLRAALACSDLARESALCACDRVEVYPILPIPQGATEVSAGCFCEKSGAGCTGDYKPVTSTLPAEVYKCSAGGLVELVNKGNGSAQLFELQADGSVMQDQTEKGRAIRRESKVHNHKTRSVQLDSEGGVVNVEDRKLQAELKKLQVLKAQLKAKDEKLSFEDDQLKAKDKELNELEAKTYSSSDLEAMDTDELMALMKSLGAKTKEVKAAMKKSIKDVE